MHDLLYGIKNKKSDNPFEVCDKNWTSDQANQ